MITITITNDFDLYKIANCGQCFRATMVNNYHRFITGQHVLYIRPISETEYEISCTDQEWTDIWGPYFDLHREYSPLRRKRKLHPFLKEAVQCGAGIRVLKQEPWEMVLTFIISQRKSIPAIASAIEMMCQRWGHPIQTPFEIVYTFPTPSDLADVTEDDLRECSLGYRAPYIYHAIQLLLDRPNFLTECTTYRDDKLDTHLQQIKGVGAKVANCIMLFAYGRTKRVPIDTWIEKVINVECNGINPFERLGNAAGIFQQYAFYYMIHRK